MNRLFSVLSGAAALLAVTVMIAGCANHSDAAPSSGAEQPALLTNETTVVFDVVPDYVFTYAENQTEDYPTTQGAYRFAQLVNERTKGRIQIRVYANAELGVPYGAYVLRTDMDSPAMLAGIRTGDVIVRLGDIPISNYADYVSALQTFDVGDKVTAAVMRKSQQQYVELEYIMTARASGQIIEDD